MNPFNPVEASNFSFLELTSLGRLHQYPHPGAHGGSDGRRF